MRNLALMWVLAACLLVCGGGAQTWYCGPDDNPRAVKAVLKDGTLTISGKGAMRDYWEPRGCILDNSDYEKVIKEWRTDSWPPWYFAVVYDSTVSITDVVIEKGVTYIGELAFGWLSGLKSITIPASVSSIGDEALGGCGVDCEMVRWNDTCVSRQTSITVATDNQHYSFENGILFNKNKTILIQYLIGGQQDAYTIPNNVNTIEKWAFAGCCSLKSVTIPNSVKTIGDRAFENCESLTSITIPNSVKTIGDRAFARCDGLTSITIPNSVTSIGREAFSYCQDLMSITIPDSVKTIEYATFDACIRLASVTIANSVTFIGAGVFENCESLTSITIPQSVTSIERMAFAGCDSLKSITLQNSIPPEIGEYAFDEISPDACFYVPMGSIDAYRNADGWKEFKCIKSIASAPK